ncbi:MAG: hypothetical protein H6R17_1128 [Proteobacteria bacterium]|nr:hypothetical protein [Pseudomonadota bacterium]
MFPRSEFRSIWEVAHNWSGQDPSCSSGESLSEDVREHILKMVWAYLRKLVSLREAKRGRSWRIPDEDLYLFVIFMNINRTRVKLLRSIQSSKFDKALYDGIYVMRADILKWCHAEYLEPPPMWQKEVVTTDTSNKKPNGRHYDEDLDKNRCQAIAMTLWDLEPKIHPAHMARSYAIRKFGNGDNYKDEDTVKNWIAEVDPIRGSRKAGRPPEPNYKIDLKLPF